MGRFKAIGRKVVLLWLNGFFIWGDVLKKILLFILINTIFFTSLNINVFAKDDLSHQDMVRLYGKDYANSFLYTSYEVTAKMAVTDDTNRAVLDQHIDNQKSYVKQRFEAYNNAIKDDGTLLENYFGTAGGLFKELSVGVLNLTDFWKDLVGGFFGNDDEEIENKCSVKKVTEQVGVYVSYAISKDCVVVYSPVTNQVFDGNPTLHFSNANRVYFGYGSSNQIWGIKKDVVDFNSLPEITTLSQFNNYYTRYANKDYFMDAYYVEKLVLKVPSSNLPVEEHYNDNNRVINNYINQMPPQNLNIPILKPEATCPDGQKAIYPDGKGGYVDADGNAADVSNCTITWKVPDIERNEDGQVTIDDKPVIIETDGNGECDSIFCFLESIIKAIGSLAKTIVTGILDGIGDVLKLLFVPSEDFWNENLNELKSLMFQEEIDEIIAAVEGMRGENSTSRTVASNDIPMGFSSGFKDIAINIMGVDGVIVDADTVNSALNKIHSWVRGFFYALLVIYNVNQIYRLIRGTTMFEGSGVKQVGGKTNDN